MQAKSRGLYWEDFEVGQVVVTPKRTITSTDIVNFACLSGDFNEVHTNFEYCKNTQFGEPISDPVQKPGLHWQLATDNWRLSQYCRPLIRLPLWPGALRKPL